MLYRILGVPSSHPLGEEKQVLQRAHVSFQASGAEVILAGKCWGVSGGSMSEKLRGMGCTLPGIGSPLPERVGEWVGEHTRWGGSSNW